MNEGIHNYLSEEQYTYIHLRRPVPPFRQSLADALFCGMYGHHSDRTGCRYCTTAKSYADSNGIYGIGMIEYEMPYMQRGSSSM